LESELWCKTSLDLTSVDGDCKMTGWLEVEHQV
jgi:hypothetical protein